ncbi:MAG: phosphatidylserine decarboxylase [Synergistaceae bacterium]|jgi:phosphatidylserine decarboxylase|nr:phosphatidylserine decarboxylase [Synergistaceae bacterium]
MRLARDGAFTIGVMSAVAVVGGLLTPVFYIVMLIPIAMAFWFYRDPDRFPPDDPSAWVSPADGRVVEVTSGAEDQYAGMTTKIGIFMNGFDVHVNRFPTDGTVEEKRYVPGKKWFAIAPKASDENERMYVGISTGQGRATVVQVAGIMARRIVSYVKVGNKLARGERYGMIKLGSRVDIYMPPSVNPVVEVGSKVRAGETIIGVVNE